jgi:hypothetical protein
MIAKELDECQERHIKVPIDSASNAASWAEAARRSVARAVLEIHGGDADHNFALNSRLTVSP